MTTAAPGAAIEDGPPAAPPPVGSGATSVGSGPPSASERLRALAVTAIDRLAGVAAAKVEEAADRLGDLAADAAQGALGRAGTGVGASAALRGGLAALQGRNPVWAAIKGAVSAMSTTTKVLLALLLILLAVLAPVLVLVLALVLLVAAIVGAVTG